MNFGETIQFIIGHLDLFFVKKLLKSLLPIFLLGGLTFIMDL
jgi:hypothetical protein